MNLCRSHVHLINPLWDACGGSEQRTLRLFELLCEHVDVSLWSETTPDKPLLGRYPVRYIDFGRGIYPTGGTQVFVGVYFEIGPWVVRACPRRLVIVYNTFNDLRLRMLAGRLAAAGWPDPELVFASAYQRQQTQGYDGIVEPSPIDLDRFRPAGDREPHAFTVGRLSRDYLLKHHKQDPDVYGRLARGGCLVRVMGGTCLAEFMAARECIELLPQAAEDAVQFLQRLDCFYYRTSPHWTETWGRVVAEAMACALPVVADRRGGFVDFVRHGENGFLFDSDDEAVDLILQLKEDPALRRHIGEAARRTMERVYSPSAVGKIVRFYRR